LESLDFFILMTLYEPWLVYLQDVLITIHANIRELQEKKSFADPDELDYIEGRLFSYHKVLSILRASAKDVGIDPHEIGL
jgi:hypothetical protein